MSELKKNFVQGKMNKDYDVRLIPEGEYIDAFNVLVSNSEGSQVGSIQNSYGIDQLSSLILPNDAETIGSASDEGNECIYWFVATNSGSSYIFEYDQKNNGIISTVLEDTRTIPNNVLNFNKQYKITGANVIYNSFNKETLLVWTDDLNPIRCINVKRAKSYGPASDANSTFSTQDISLYKRQPHFAPVCTPTTTGDGLENNMKERFLSFGYRWKYLDGEYSAVSTFSNPQFYPGKFHLDYLTNENLGMINQFNAVNIEFNTGDKNVTDIQLVFKESNSNTIWIVDTFNKKKQTWVNNITQSFTFSNDKIYSVLPADEVNRLYDNIPVVSKAQDFIGNRLIYGNYVEGRDLIDQDGNNIHINYNLTHKNEILTTSKVVSNIITTTNPSDTLEIDFTLSTIKKDEILSILFRATSPTPFFGNYLFEQSLYLQNDYPNAAALQSSSEFVNFISNVCSINFSNYNTGSHIPVGTLETEYLPFQILPSTDANKIQIKLPSIKYKISTTPTYSYELYKIYTNTNYITLSNGNAYSSCKSNRSYETGIVYLDEDGRYSTVITNDVSSSQNNCFIPISFSDTKNSLVLNIKHKAPYWAKKYKVFVKENKLEYQTIYGVIVYIDKNHIWLKLEGQDKNKVQDGDSLVVKRNSNGVNQILYKAEVLEYKQQVRNFLPDVSGDELPGNYIKLKNDGGLYTDSSLASFNQVFTHHTSSYANIDQFYLDILVNSGPILAGSKIQIHISNARTDTDYPADFNSTYVVQNNYDNFALWFNTEANGLGGVFPHYQAIGSVLKVWNVVPGDTASFHSLLSYMDGTISIISSSGVLILETEPKDKKSDVYFETPDTYLIDSSGNHLSNSIISGDVNQNGTTTPATLNLSFFNCYCQGNGAESYIVKDLFNANFLSTNTRPNAVELDGYKERRNIASMTYSGSFDKTTNYNSLNEFNLSRANYKDLDDKYGSIQKLFSRDTDLIVFQEDKIHRILYNKNLLSDAVGGGQITSVEDILGQEVPFTGEWGIGKNPETFSNYANNIYFTDQPKGVVLRLGGDGLEPISRYGMKDWFRDNLRGYSSNFIVGGFDPSYDNYILGFTDEARLSKDLEVMCNQVVSSLTIPAGESILYNINTTNKVGDYTFNYDIPVGELDVTIDISGGHYENTGLTESGTITINKRTTIEEATVLIQNNGIVDSIISFSNGCPETPELEVITLVVNDIADSSKSMGNQYTWVDSTYGYSGGSYDTDTFNSSGLTRFRVQSGEESFGPIPFEGSLVRVSSIKVSGEFTSCNRIGYIITSDDLDAQGVLDNATYTSVTNYGNENYIEFTYERLGDLSKKLYIVWDYIDNVSTTQNNVLQNIYSGNSFTINALNNVTKQDPYTIDIITYPSHGSLDLVGDNITYINDGVDLSSDFFIYRVLSGECHVDIRVDINVNQVPVEEIPCYEWVIYADGYYNSCDYIDCDGSINTAIADGFSAGGFTQTTFCARSLVGGGNNVVGGSVICSF